MTEVYSDPMDGPLEQARILIGGIQQRHDKIAHAVRRHGVPWVQVHPDLSVSGGARLKG